MGSLTLGKRNIRRSLFRYVRETLAVRLGPEYRFFGEDDLRELQNKTNPVELQRPYVFLVDTFLRPVETALPIVMVDVPVSNLSPFEMGNRSGRSTDCIFHVMGRMRGERDDIGSELAESLQTQVPMYSFSSGSPVLVEWAAIEDDQVVEEEAPLTRDQLRQEMSADYWEMVKFTLITRR